MGRACKALMDAAFLADTRFGELLLALALIWRGVWLLVPHLYDVALYEIVRQIAPPWLWAAAFLVCGSTRLLALASERLCWRQRSTLSAAGLWAIWAAGLIAITPGAIGTPLPLMVLCEVLVWQRLAAVKRLAKREVF